MQTRSQSSSHLPKSRDDFDSPSGDRRGKHKGSVNERQEQGVTVRSRSRWVLVDEDQCS